MQGSLSLSSICHMDMWSRAGTMIGLSRLCRLVLRALRKIRAFSPALPFVGAHQKDGEHVHPPSEQSEAAAIAESPQLPMDMLIEIFNLLEIPDLVRAGSVCSSWHAAYTSLRSHGGWYQRLQTPCLLYTSESDADNVACLYSLADKRVYKLTLPEPPICSRHLIGSSNGWLVTADDKSELHILNPITGVQISLPPVATIEQVEPIFNEAGAVQEYELWQYYGEEETVHGSTIHALDDLRDNLYFKAFVFPVTGGSYIVVLIHSPFLQLSCAREGDSEWTWLPPSAAYEDCIYMDGLLYAVTSTGGIEAFSLTGPSILRKVVMEDTKDCIYEHLYFVQTPSGDVLQVWREQDTVKLGQDEGDNVTERDLSEITMETRKITLHKVDMVAKELVAIHSLHDHVLFLGRSQSQCLSTKEYPQLKGNHVYMADHGQVIAFWKTNRRDIGLFNLDDNITEEIVPPQMWCNWPTPVWITPTLTKLGLE